MATESDRLTSTDRIVAALLAVATCIRLEPRPEGEEDALNAVMALYETFLGADHA